MTMRRTLFALTPVLVAILCAAPAGWAGKHSGLWSGSVTVNKVSRTNSDPNNLEPAAPEFSFTVLLHVDGSDNVWLLSDVIQMWQNGEYRDCVPDDPDCPCLGDDTRKCPDPNKPGTYVLLTDEDRVAEFEGASLRGGQPVGHRLSVAAYAFDTDDTINTLYDTGKRAMATTGAFQYPNINPGQVSTVLVLSRDFPLNPFRHLYHPDHDNKDALYGPIQSPLPGEPDPYEVPEITRTMAFIFTQDDPESEDPPNDNPKGWGDTVVGGDYKETIAGLHSTDIDPDPNIVNLVTDIVVEGWFRLRKVCQTDTLNP